MEANCLKSYIGGHYSIRDYDMGSYAQTLTLTGCILKNKKSK